MKQGFYYKLNGKWNHNRKLESTLVSVIEETFYYGPNNLVFNITKWQYSNTKNPTNEHFQFWVTITPPEEDLLILEMMFP